jgi:hypothetical protein
VEQLVKDIGAYAGLAAFLGLAVLSLLYFSQARDIRRLRDWAGRAPERDAEEIESTSDLAAERAEEIRRLEEERRGREEAARVENAANAKRDERRRRREAGLPETTRRERMREWLSGLGAGHRRPEPRYIALVVGAVIVLGAGVAVAASQLIGDDGGNAGSGGKVLKPGQVQVDVLNGTNPPVNGLAGLVSDRLESSGYHTGRVTDTSQGFETSVVMYKRGYAPEAKMIARKLQIRKTSLLNGEIRSDANSGNPVAVVMGQDKAGFSG